MAPLKPHWAQPSHPEILEVIVGADGEFSSKSVSKIDLAPNGVYAGLTCPPCTFVDESSYASVQVGRDSHILLNSDLLYLNHSCEPSLVGVYPAPPPSQKDAYPHPLLHTHTHLSSAPSSPGIDPARRGCEILDHRYRPDADPRRPQRAASG